jgi:hypothetical protein
MKTDTQQLVMRVASEHPTWIPVLAAACKRARAAEPYGGEFAGAWVFDEIARQGAEPGIPNLRPLASFGLIEKSGESTRGGNRAYYRMPDREAIERALETLKAINSGPAGPKG